MRRCLAGRWARGGELEDGGGWWRLVEDGGGWWRTVEDGGGRWVDASERVVLGGDCWEGGSYGGDAAVAGVSEVRARSSHSAVGLRAGRGANHLQSLGLHSSGMRIQHPDRQRRDLSRTDHRSKPQVSLAPATSGGRRWRGDSTRMTRGRCAHSSPVCWTTRLRRLSRRAAVSCPTPHCNTRAPAPPTSSPGSAFHRWSCSSPPITPVGSGLV